ncbi:PREDICTED: protein decapping 5-like isoform X1 [Lupinus angustifolius]|uniref:protein decapping 5-like isoform X1 n=1 Tax=Lupinus angustifolius TaxID=3871 RepID=UPI00092EDCC0|nr:PREDICTED: protein decapping 5-like isoform X1 [Lupinus angustifolius]
MASDTTSRSNSAADSYIGSLISLTSKSEIRYEGVLYNINTDESSIGLRNVRSFGTEGRKKDGQQIPPGDKVYEYILFRGSDIKDLQVKSSPPVQPTPQVNNDPAIIQSQYVRPVTTSTSLPNAASGSLADLSSHTTQLGLPGSNFQGPLPLYQPGGNIGSWGASPSAPNANGDGLAMPMYWQGYYGAPNGLPNFHQQSLLRPPPGLLMPPSMQHPMQYPNFSLSLSTGSSNLPELPPSLLQVSNVASSLTSTSLPPSNLYPAPSSLPEAPSALPEAPSVLPHALSALPPAPSTLPPAPSASLAFETFPLSLTDKAPNVSLPSVTPAANLPSLTPLANSGSEMNAVAPPISSKPNAISGSSLAYQTVSQLSPSVVGSSNSTSTETPVPSLVTPGQLLQPGSTVVSSVHHSQTPHKDVEVVQVLSTSSPQPSRSVSAENQPPILPLPVTSQSSHRPGGAPIQNYRGYGYRGRGRGRGTGVLRPATKFTEDFDFNAMNEKFKKDEVWGDLGKSNKSHLKEKDGEENSFDEDYSLDEDNDDSSNSKQPVYNKDDFFDSLSSNALDRASQNGRIRYSEQIKIDTETFGDFARHRGGRGGRGPFRGGHPSRGGYYGRGYGYSGRGRGRGMPSRSF